MQPSRTGNGLLNDKTAETTNLYGIAQDSQSYCTRWIVKGGVKLYQWGGVKAGQ
jgi:hypothetical protein